MRQNAVSMSQSYVPRSLTLALKSDSEFSATLGMLMMGPSNMLNYDWLKIPGNRFMNTKQEIQQCSLL